MNKTEIAYPRIIFSLLVYFLFPLSADFLNSMVDSPTITATLITSAIAFVLILFNWDVLQRHIRRFSEDLKEGLLFFVIGLLAAGMLMLFNHFFLHAPIWELESDILLHYTFFLPLILLVYSVCSALSFSLAFKILMDRIHLPVRESFNILISGVLFGLLCTLSMTPGTPELFLRLFLFEFLFAALASYLYNQTHSIIPMVLAHSLVLLICGILTVL